MFVVADVPHINGFAVRSGHLQALPGRPVVPDRILGVAAAEAINVVEAPILQGTVNAGCPPATETLDLGI